jgi:hypothetical protein
VKYFALRNVKYFAKQNIKEAFCGAKSIPIEKANSALSCVIPKFFKESGDGAEKTLRVFSDIRLAASDIQPYG